MERSKLKQGRSKSDTKENSLTQLSRFFLSRSILQFSSPQTTTLTPIERVCTGLEILCSCLRQHCYPEKQVANYTFRNSQHTDSAVKLLPKVPIPLLLWPLVLSPLPMSDALSVVSVQLLQSGTMHQYSEMSQLKNNPGFGRFVLRGL